MQMDFLHVKVDIVSCDKFSAEVGDNLDANYKRAQSYVPFASLITRFPPTFIRGWQRSRETDKNTDIENGICSAVKQAFRH